MGNLIDEYDLIEISDIKLLRIYFRCFYQISNKANISGKHRELRKMKIKEEYIDSSPCQ